MNVTNKFSAAVYGNVYFVILAYISPIQMTRFEVAHPVTILKGHSPMKVGPFYPYL